MNINTWRFVRDVIEGSDSVKKHAKTYVPQGKIEDEDYADRIKRAEFFPATSRTAEGVHGLAFSKEPQITNLDDNLREYLQNVDGKGNDIYKFINDCTWEDMITNHGGCLLDAPNGEGLSQAAAELVGIRPYIISYRAEQILEIRTKTVGRAEVISMVRLKEYEVVPKEGDEYTTELKERYRVLKLDENGDYVHSYYDEKENEIFTTIPKKFGKPLKYIPFYIKDIIPLKPIFKDLADVNIAHFQVSVDHRNALHWIGAPTPFISGYQPETKTRQLADGTIEEYAVDTLKLGANKVNYLPMGATANYLELGGSGLQHLVNAMEADEEKMAILGARIISQEKKGVESAETARIHRAGENSVIATFCNEESKMFTRLFKDYLEWTVGRENTVDENFAIKINTDYETSKMSPSEIGELISAWQQGAISRKILFANLKEGEVIDNATSYEQMIDDIQEEKETMTSVQNMNQTDNGDDNEKV